MTRLAREHKINRTKRDALFVRTGVSYQMEVCIAVIIDLVVSPVSIGGINVSPVVGREAPYLASDFWDGDNGRQHYIRRRPTW